MTSHPLVTNFSRVRAQQYGVHADEIAARRNRLRGGLRWNDRRLAEGEEPALGSHLVTRTWAPPRPCGRGFSHAIHSWTHSLGSTSRRSLRLRGSDSASAVSNRREQLSPPQQQLRALLRVVSARRTSQRAGREGARTAPTIRTRHRCSSCRVASCFGRFELLELTWTACLRRALSRCSLHSHQTPTVP